MTSRNFVVSLRVTVACAAVIVFVILITMGAAAWTAFLDTGWVFLVGVLGALALYRIMLSRYDRRLQHAGTDGMSPIHLWFMNREARIDHLLIPLTVGAVLYSVALSVFIANQLLNETIRRIVTTLTFH